MHKRSLFAAYAVLLLALVCRAVAPAAAAETGEAAAAPSAPALYAQAITAMDALVQPAYVTYRLEGTSDGLNVEPVVLKGQVWLNISVGTAPADWTLRHRTYDYQSEIVNAANGQRYVSQRSFFDPTWYGAYRALREGMLDAQDPAPTRPPPSDTTPPPPTLKTIGVVAVMGPGIYRIEDRGDAQCANGDDGRALHLTARQKDPQRQLSDVIIDVRSLRFCMMRFASPSGFGFRGTVENHYADVGGYWMQTDGIVDGSLRAFGISMHHGVWRYRLVDMQFPLTLAPDIFAPNVAATPTPAPSPHE